MKTQFPSAMNWGILQQQRLNQSHMIRSEQAAEAAVFSPKSAPDLWPATVSEAR
jgi:hypothetical protein